MKLGQNQTVEKHKWFLPWWWYVGLFLLTAAGLLLILFNPQLSRYGLGKLSGRVKPDAWAMFGGILILSVVFSHIVVFTVSRLLILPLRLNMKQTHADMLSPAFLGISESVMYPMALFFGKPEFIGVWLAIKVAGNWVAWKGDDVVQPSTEGAPSMEQINKGRRRFNAFLVGNSLMVMLGIATWGALKIWVLREALPIANGKL